MARSRCSRVIVRVAALEASDDPIGLQFQRMVEVGDRVRDLVQQHLGHRAAVEIAALVMGPKAHELAEVLQRQNVLFGFEIEAAAVQQRLDERTVEFQHLAEIVDGLLLVALVVPRDGAIVIGDGGVARAGPARPGSGQEQPWITWSRVNSPVSPGSHHTTDCTAWVRASAGRANVSAAHAPRRPAAKRMKSPRTRVNDFTNQIRPP